MYVIPLGSNSVVTFVKFPLTIIVRLHHNGLLNTEMYSLTPSCVGDEHRFADFAMLFHWLEVAFGTKQDN